MKKRVVPALLLNRHSIVKTVQFKNARTVGDAVAAIRVFASRNADELAVFAIDRRPIEELVQFVRQVSQETTMPLLIGGNVRSYDEAICLLRSGADKVGINTLFFRNPGEVKRITEAIGSQSITLVLDYLLDGEELVFFSQCGTRRERHGLQEVLELINETNVGEVVLQAMSRDGMMEGMDLTTIGVFRSHLKIPIVAMGGCGDVEDASAGIQAGADAIACSSIFFWAGETIQSISEHLSYAGYDVRNTR